MIPNTASRGGIPTVATCRDRQAQHCPLWQRNTGGWAIVRTIVTSYNENKMNIAGYSLIDFRDRAWSPVGMTTTQRIDTEN